SSLAKFLGSLKIHWLGMARSNFFIVIAVAILIDVPILLTEATQGYGTQSFPVTYRVIDLIREDVSFFLLIVITYLSGAMVWKDREGHVDEIADATPTPEWVLYAARVVTLLVMVLLILAAALVGGIVVQAAYDYHRFQFSLYAHELFVREASGFVFLAI